VTDTAGTNIDLQERENSGGSSSGASKEELLRKRFEFLGLEPEKSEEYQKLMEGLLQ